MTRKTEYIQSDYDIREIEDGNSYCEFCLKPLRDSYDPNRSGHYEVFIQEDREGTQLVGFVCRECVEKEEEGVRASLI